VPAKRFFKNAFPVLLLTAVVAVAVALLSYTDGVTRDKISANEQQKTEALLYGMFPDMSRYELEDDIFVIYSDGEQIGYAFEAVGSGYGGDIKILVGLEDETTIKDITIVSHTETPGLGEKVTASAFTDQFTGLSVEDVALSRDGGKIDAITGATISSTAVVNAVRETALEKVKLLKEIE
jgi:electron transport complex protein RnfG